MISQIFPFLAAASTLVLPELNTLPVEMWVQILRNLTPAALLNAIRASRHWMNVARGDPVLRQSVRQQLQLERQQRQQLVTNPGLFITVHRREDGEQLTPPTIFGRNVAKTVTNNYPELMAAVMTSIEPVVGLGRQIKRKNCGRRIQKHKTSRAVPYKTLRC